MLGWILFCPVLNCVTVTMVTRFRTKITQDDLLCNSQTWYLRKAPGKLPNTWCMFHLTANAPKLWTSGRYDSLGYCWKRYAVFSFSIGKKLWSLHCYQWFCRSFSWWTELNTPKYIFLFHKTKFVWEDAPTNRRETYGLRNHQPISNVVCLMIVMVSI